ncbi:hypothetical protein ACP70R_045558 [Stipagrostis hirtigluma subsp. patula]
MARVGFIDDSGWPEVNTINNYALFNWYLMMGVSGLGGLAIPWNTAVLLGGFVPDLETKDFWCLVAIWVIQATRVVDLFLKKKFREILLRILHKLNVLSGYIINRCHPWKVIQILGYLILLCLLAPVSVLGLYISTGISVYRLIEHNYGNNSGSANLKPALYILYSLAVAQGVLYGYKTINNAIGSRTKQAEFVASRSSVDTELVLDYLDYIRAECTKDPSFTTRRNLVTYAIDSMMECKSNDTFIVGIKVLGQVIQPDNCDLGRLVLAKHMLTASASFCHLIQRLLETLGPRSPYSQEIRENAARIVALVAGDIHLEQFPRGIQCISSLLDKSLGSELRGLLPKDYQRGWLLEEYERDYLFLVPEIEDRPQGHENNPRLGNLGYARLVIQGLRILRKLVVDEDNCRLIINTKGLLSKITNAFLTSNQVHISYHDEWGNMVEESLDLMSLLMVAPWETETKFQIEISSNIRENSTENICTLEGILQCCKCSSLKKRKAIELFLLFFDPSVDMSSIMASGSSSRMLKWILLAIFLLSDISHIRKLACKKLQAILASQSEECAKSPSQSVLVDLITTLVDARHNTDRLHAAQILEQLCHHYTKDDEYLKQLKQAVAAVMPQVLKEIFCYATREENQAVIEANNVQFPVPSTDLESGGVSQENGEQQEGSKLQEVLISLCWIIWVKWYSVPDSDMMTCQLDEIAEIVCLEQGKPVKRFGKLVIEARELLKKKRSKGTSENEQAEELAMLHQIAFQVKPKCS